MKLTENFSLNELTKSQTAERKGIDNTPSAEHQENLKSLCEMVLQPIRDHFGQVVSVSSGYRSPEHNRRVGGAENSLHMQALALDIVFTDGGVTAKRQEIIQVASAIGFQGIGIYSSSFHFDMRSGGRQAWGFGYEFEGLEGTPYEQVMRNHLNGVYGDGPYHPANSEGEQGEQGELSSTGSVAGESDARSNAENYLGRSMSDQEWEYLVRATAAEASAHPQERGAVMGVILNRARTNFNGYGTSVIDQLHARNQFQAVTGTRANGHQPSTWFTNMTTDTRGHIINSTQYLNAVDRDWFNFTSNNPAAYGRGTDITFLYGMRSNPVNRVIGDTIFGNR